MDYVWGIIEPYVLAVVAFITGTGLGATILRALLNKIFNKNSKMLDSAFNADKVAQKTADKLAGKTLNIDVTAVTEKALKKTTTQLDKRIQKVEDTANALVSILVPIAKGIAKFKALSDAERDELTGAIRLLEGAYERPDDNSVMTVVLEPITISEESEDDSEEAPPTDTGVNFGGLETK